MTPDFEHPTARRDFLGRLAGTAVAIVGTGCATSGATSTPAPSPATAGAAPARPKPASEFDDTWTTRLTGRHKSVFDNPTVNDGTQLDHAESVISGYRTALGASDSDMTVVIVIRHQAIQMALNDAMWAKYDFGTDLKLKDPTTGDTAKRNPFYHLAPGDRHASIGREASLESLSQRGAIILACNVALMARASALARKTNTDLATVQQELRANLVPGAILQPNGIYAVARAQEMGCALIAAG